MKGDKSREKQEWWIGRGAEMDGQEGKYSDEYLHVIYYEGTTLYELQGWK